MSLQISKYQAKPPRLNNYAIIKGGRLADTFEVLAKTPTDAKFIFRLFKYDFEDIAVLRSRKDS